VKSSLLPFLKASAAVVGVRANNPGLFIHCSIEAILLKGFLLFELFLKPGIFFFQPFVLKQKVGPKIQADQKCRAEKQKESEEVKHHSIIEKASKD
jgi:hypothetical protein